MADEQAGWMEEWDRIYHQLNERDRRGLYRLMCARLDARFERRQRRARLADLWARRSPRPTPMPIRLPLFHAALTFLCLGLLPSHPLAIPTAVGIALVVVVYIQILAYGAGYHL